MGRAILLDELEESLNADEIQDPTQDTPDIQDFQEQQPVEQELEEELPDRYRGKSVKDLVRMHQEAEKLIGKHGSEVGELRKIVDQYIQTQLQANKQNEPEEQLEEVDFFVDPKTAVKHEIENHPSIKQAKQYTEEARKAAALSVVKNKHPEMEDILKDPNFAAWIQSSKIRTQLFVMADQRYDADAADELFSLWKDRQQTVQNTATVEKAARRDALKSASTGTVRGSAEQRAKKKFRRADIINLMKTDPARYEALQPEIMQAYAEGRVI
jgi:hypothetical protein